MWDQDGKFVVVEMDIFAVKAEFGLIVVELCADHVKSGVLRVVCKLSENLVTLAGVAKRQRPEVVVEVEHLVGIDCFWVAQELH